MAKKSPINDLVRKRLKDIRLSKGFKLREVAAGSGIPVSSLSQIESGYYRVHLDFLFRILGFLDADISDVWPVEAVGASATSESLYVQRIQAFRLNEVCDWLAAEGACLFVVKEGRCSVLLRQRLSDWLLDRVSYCLEDGRTYTEGLLLEKSWEGSRFVLYLKTKQHNPVGRAMAERYLIKWAALYSDPTVASACLKVTRPR